MKHNKVKISFMDSIKKLLLLCLASFLLDSEVLAAEKAATKGLGFGDDLGRNLSYGC